MLQDESELTPSLQGWRLTRSFGSGDTRAVALEEVSIDLYPGQIASVGVDTCTFSQCTTRLLPLCAD